MNPTVMNLGIYAPYRRGETTAAALRVADLALSYALDVRWLSSTPVERGVHHYWDEQVGVVGGNNIYHWSSRCDYMLWFEPNELNLIRSQVLPLAQVKNVLVPMWHRLAREETSKICLYDKIVAPSYAAIGRLAERVCVDMQRSYDVAWCQWTSHLPVVKRRCSHTDKSVRIYVPLDGATIDNAGEFTLDVLGATLENNINVRFTVNCEKSWPRSRRMYLRRLQEFWGERLQVHQSINTVRQTAQFYEHDWTYLPNTSSNTANIASSSLHCGTPVICYDVSPLNEIVRHEHSGLLLKCDVDCNWFGAPTAKPKLPSAVRLLGRAINEKGLHSKICRADWYLEELQSTFRGFWAKEWGIT